MLSNGIGCVFSLCWGNREMKVNYFGQTKSIEAG